MKTTHFLLFYLFSISTIFSKENIHVISCTEKENYESKKDEYLQKNTIKIAFNSNNATTQPIIGDVYKALTISNQIDCIPFSIKNTAYKKEKLYKKLSNNECNLYLNFIFDKDSISWELHDTSQAQILKKEKYIYKSNDFHLCQSICTDIWKELFGDELSPFSSFLCYLNTADIKTKQKKIHTTQIHCINPLLPEYKKMLLQIQGDIVYLSALKNKSHKHSLLFLTTINGKLFFMKLPPYGVMKKVMENKEMIISPKNRKKRDIFYIKNGFLWRRFFNKKKNRICESKLSNNDRSFASLYPIPGKNILLVSKNHVIYKLYYELNKKTNEIKKMTAVPLSKKNEQASNMTYNPQTNSVIYSKKIGYFFQIVSLSNDKEEEILTHTNSHKQDPSISPCGNYIAYVAHTKDQKRFIEVVNLYTKKIMRVIKEPGLYRYPTWVTK